MINKTWRATVLAVVSAAAMLGAVLVCASPASADIGDTAVAGTPPSFGSGQCKTVDVATACFEPAGDKIWVYDALADHQAAAGYWENYLRDGSRGWHLYRYGQCNNHLGAGHWGYCNYNFYEDTSYNANGGYGSGVRAYPSTENGVKDGGYAWVRNNG